VEVLDDVLHPATWSKCLVTVFVPLKPLDQENDEMKLSLTVGK